MSSEIIALCFFGLAIVMLCLGLHIGLVLTLAGIMGIMVVTGSFPSALGTLKTTPYAAVAIYDLSVVPLFILMGMFSLHGGISEGIYNAFNGWVGRVRGGLGIATTWACTVFGATSGSSIAAASVFSKVSLPEMRKAGYEPNFACAGIATAATIAMLIPPSLYLVIYGMLAEAPIGQMLMAGFLPGILMASILSFGIFVMAVRSPGIAPKAKSSISWKERMVLSGKAWPMLVLALIIIGGIYSGVFTPTEAASVAAFAALVISAAQRKINWDKIKTSLIETAFTSAMLMFVIIGATIFSRLLTVSGLTIWLGKVVVASGLTTLQLIIVLMVLFIILGCFIDALSIMFITMPVFIPIVEAFGIDLVWFGVLTTVALNLGVITPPFGLCVYTVKAVAGQDVTVEGIFKAAFPMYIPVLVTLVILVAFPAISLIIPQTMTMR